MRDEKEERKKQARSNKQTNKAKQHSSPKAVTCTCIYNTYTHSTSVVLQSPLLGPHSKLYDTIHVGRGNNNIEKSYNYNYILVQELSCPGVYELLIG